MAKSMDKPKKEKKKPKKDAGKPLTGPIISGKDPAKKAT